MRSAAVCDCVEGRTAGGQHDTGHRGLPVRYATGPASECVHGCVVILGVRLGECQPDATARVVPVAVYSAPRLAPLRRIPLPFPVDQVTDLLAGKGIRAPERVKPAVLTTPERFPGLVVDPWAGIRVQGQPAVYQAAGVIDHRLRRHKRRFTTVQDCSRPRWLSHGGWEPVSDRADCRAPWPVTRDLFVKGGQGTLSAVARNGVMTETLTGSVHYD